jgi:hypothetical protein
MVFENDLELMIFVHFSVQNTSLNVQKTLR